MDDAELLERLVRCYSPSGREQRAVAAFVAGARALGYSASVDAVGNGIARRGRGRPETLFLGHIDTVDGERPVRWTGHRLHGRGVVDAKGALAAALAAGADFAGPGALTVVAAVGEETDSRGTRRLLRGRRPDAVIAGEPSGWDGLTVGYKGDLRIARVFRGRRRHYSAPYLTAADRAVAWCAAVRAWSEARTTESLFRSVTAKTIALATGPPGDAEVARATIDVRLPPGLPVEAALRALPGDPADGAVTVEVAIDPCDTGSANPVARALIAGIRGAGGRPTIFRKAGTSDLNLAIAAWGIPGAAYGPGDARLDHTARELLDRRELARSVAVLRTAYAALATAGITPPGSAGAP
ncbi:MAG TPA: M20/M25/M40 family metallo-hydrolase [Thermoplasmata archaeon]|nr:M20/M25/M40 family metallo-hydrolase [Thermoplasmata archaeon]